MNRSLKTRDSLPVLEPPAIQREHESGAADWKNYTVHPLRILLFVAILLMIRHRHQRMESLRWEQSIAPAVAIQDLQQWLPRAAKMTPWQDGMAEVFDAQENQIGQLIHTVSESRQIVGYVGSTVLLIVFDSNEQLDRIIILESEDTPEHVDAIRKDRAFLEQWQGLDRQGAANLKSVDTVSGATLTSLAIIQSLRRTLGNENTDSSSSKFPQAVQVTELHLVWPSATRLESTRMPGWFQVLNADEELLGFALRTSPAADSIIGYRGPSDCLFFFDTDARYLRGTIRSSYDNSEPESFVDYVRQDEYFLIEQFQGLSLAELVDYDELEVEGVSGATMTSRAVFLSLQLAARKQQEAANSNLSDAGENHSTHWYFTFRDLGTLVVLLLAVLTTFFHGKRIRFLRWVHRWILVIYLGFLNGDILSQTLWVGWVQNGVPLQHAVGLAALSLAAILIPIATKRNIYCNSVCPFGAAQMLAGRLIRRKPKPPASINRYLKYLPGILIGLVVLTAVGWFDLNLAAIEPFDAFSLRIAGWATISIAVIGLLASIRTPMAYCRWGCPTGAMLKYLKRNAKSNEWKAADLFAVAILLFVLILWLWV